MAKSISITVPVNTDTGKKIVPIEAKVSDGTIEHEGSDFFLIQHSGSGFRYLADQQTVDSLENSELDSAMDELAAEEGF
jgi:hypothetical protein